MKDTETLSKSLKNLGKQCIPLTNMNSIKSDKIASCRHQNYVIPCYTSKIKTSPTSSKLTPTGMQVIRRLLNFRKSSNLTSSVMDGPNRISKKTNCNTIKRYTTYRRLCQSRWLCLPKNGTRGSCVAEQIRPKCRLTLTKNRSSSTKRLGCRSGK